MFDGPYRRGAESDWQAGRLKWGFELADGRRVTNVAPRPGFPATFTSTGCGFMLHRGERVVLQRNPGGTDDDMFLGGPVHARDLVTWPAAMGGIAFAAVFAWRLGSALVQRWWHQRTASRRAQDRSAPS